VFVKKARYDDNLSNVKIEEPLQEQIENNDDDEMIDYKNASHAANHKVLSLSHLALQQMHTLLVENPHVCSQERWDEWCQEIQHCLSQKPPSPVIGVLRDTGVRKSTLIDTLLDEVKVLPTSGSQGCTATIVELQYNANLLLPTAELEGESETLNTPVYKGKVQFISF